jgi:mitotic spindle assembly checkpoint protein MAD1
VNCTDTQIHVGDIGAKMLPSKRSRGEGDDSESEAVDLGEQRLLNEQLTERLQMMKEAEERDKKRFVRQLNFLEGENSELREAISHKTEQYFEDKKKWQVVLQETEKAAREAAKLLPPAASQTTSAAAVAPSSSSSSTTSQSDGLIQQHQDAYWAEKFASLEEQIQGKTDEALRATAAQSAAEATLIEAQARCAQLEGRVAAAMGTDGASARGRVTDGDHDHDAGERQLEVRCSDLENQLRKVNREHERVLKKLQNQALLEDEMAQLSTRLKLKESAGTAAHVLGVNYERLKSEKNDWTLLFAAVLGEDHEPSISDSASSLTGAKGDITPAKVYRALSDAQRQTSVLLKKHSDQEIQLAELSKAQLKCESALQDVLSDKDSLTLAKDGAESSLRRQRQQTRLFEGEVKSLRALMKSYNNELSIGTKGGSKDADTTAHTNVLKIKDDTISDLQQQLDTCRTVHADLISEVETLRAGPLTTASAAAAAAAAPIHLPASPQISARQLDAQRDESVALRTQIHRLKDELLGLQKATGLDFVPERVRVLHLRKNPAAVALGEPTDADASSSGSSNALTRPLEELRRLRDENRRLRDMALHATASMSDENSDPVQGMGGLSSTPGPHTPAAGQQSSHTPATSTPNVGGAGLGPGPDSSKLNQRLKEMFRERITCFREAVYLLTGYKIDLHSPDGTVGAAHPRLKLRSMYAEDPEDALLFQWRGDSLELMETPFAKNIDPRLLSILRGTNSVPAFLANATLELFEKQTFV